MATTKPTGEQLANQVRHHAYDPDFLAGLLISFVGKVADVQTVKPPRVAAREVLEKLADFDTFVADIPVAEAQR